MQFSPDGSKIVSGSWDKTIKVWDGAPPIHPNHLSLANTDASCASLSFSASLNEIGSTNTGSAVFSVEFSPDGTKIVSGLRSGTIKVWDAESLTMIEEREGDGATIDSSGEVAERDGATLRLKEGGGAFYAPSPLQCAAVHWPRLVAGAQSGELYHLQVEG